MVSSPLARPIHVRSNRDPLRGVFDFNDFEYIELQYCKIVILEIIPSHPELVGREALVEVKDVRMAFENLP